MTKSFFSLNINADLNIKNMEKIMKKYFPIVSTLMVITFLVITVFLFNCQQPAKKKDSQASSSSNTIFTATKKIYWTSWENDAADPVGRIKCADMNNLTNKVTLIDNLNYCPTSIEIDSAGKKMYWIDATNKRILRSNLDGTGIEEIISGLTDVPDICLYPDGNKIFFTDNGKIKKADLDGTNLGDLVNMQGTHIVIDPAEGKLFWASLGAGIWQSGINGANAERIYGGDTQFDMALDTQNKKIYFAPNLASSGLTLRNYDGTGSANIDLGGTITTNFIINPFTGKIYYICLFGVTSSIKQCNLDGTGKTDFIAEDSDYRVSIAFEYE